MNRFGAASERQKTLRTGEERGPRRASSSVLFELRGRDNPPTCLHGAVRLLDTRIVRSRPTLYRLGVQAQIKRFAELVVGLIAGKGPASRLEELGNTESGLARGTRR